LSIILYCTKLHSYKCNDSWIVSVKQNMNFNFQPPSTFVFLFLFFAETVLLKAIHRLKIYHGPMLTGETCIHLRSLNGCHFGMIVRDCKVWRRGCLQWHGLPTKYNKDVIIVSIVIGGGGGTDRQPEWWSHKRQFTF
jgi:hypothetical protein